MGFDIEENLYDKERQWKRQTDEETKWNFGSSGDEGGTAVEVPAVVLPKPKKTRSKAQLAAFEKARAARAANILKKKEAKSAPAPEPVEQAPARVKKVRENVLEWGGGELNGVVKCPPTTPNRKMDGELFL